MSVPEHPRVLLAGDCQTCLWGIPNPGHRCLTIGNGVRVHHLPYSFLDRASELAVRATQRSGHWTVAALNPEWLPVWEWCRALGRCVAPVPSVVLQHALTTGFLPEAFIPPNSCRCGLLPATSETAFLGSHEPASGADGSG